MLYETENMYTASVKAGLEAEKRVAPPNQTLL